jgi:hypothetical protein
MLHHPVSPHSANYPTTRAYIVSPHFQNPSALSKTSPTPANDDDILDDIARHRLATKTTPLCSLAESPDNPGRSSTSSDSIRACAMPGIPSPRKTSVPPVFRRLCVRNADICTVLLSSNPPGSIKAVYFPFFSLEIDPGIKRMKPNVDSAI